MNIELINIGSELLMGQVLNSHQQFICRELFQRGYEVSRQVGVSDDGECIRNAVAEAMGRAELIIATGGLGPTSDDRTRDMVAELLGLELEPHAPTLLAIEQFFASRKRRMPESTKTQALVPKGAAVLANKNGTAPGLAIPLAQGGLLIMLPGPPRELRPMFLESVVPMIEAQFPLAEPVLCSIFRTTGIGESFLEERIVPALQPLLNEGLEVGYCARVGEVDVRFVSRSGPGLMEKARASVVPLFHEFIYGEAPENLESAIVRLLAEKKKSLATAESCTGGFISNRITNVPGASSVFLGGVVTYANSAKEKFLGVKSSTLSAHGAVSEQTAMEMADGIRQETGADYALAVTGIAGPGGGAPEKPVGLVYIGLSGGAKTVARRFLNQYDRETFKYLTSQQALEMLRKELIGL
jgi:nicotinamide-nucleotide amidase